MPKDYESVYDITIDQDSLEGTRNTADDGTIIIPAPGAGNHIRIRELQLQLTEAGPVTVSLKTDAATIVRTFRFNEDGNGFAILYPRGLEWNLPDNKGLYIALTAAKAVDYYIRYLIVRSE